MSEEPKAAVVSSTTNIDQPSIEQFFGTDAMLNKENRLKVDSIFHMVSEDNNDHKTIMDIVKALDKQIGPEEKSSERITKIFDTVKGFKLMKIPMRSVLEALGDTLVDLEKQAVETGNWTRFLKRVAKNNAN